MFPTNWPTPSALPSCVSPTSSVSSSDFNPFSRLGTLPPMPSASDDEFTLPSPRFNPRRAAIKPLVFSALHERHCLMTASAPSPPPSRNHLGIQWNGPYGFPHHLHRKSRSTKPMKAKTHSSASPLSPAFPPAGKWQNERSFVPNYPLPPIPALVPFSFASSFIASSSSSSEWTTSRHLSIVP